MILIFKKVQMDSGILEREEGKEKGREGGREDERKRGREVFS